MERSAVTTVGSQDTRSRMELHRCEVTFLSIAFRLLTTRLLLVTVVLLPGIRSQCCKYLNWTQSLGYLSLCWSLTLTILKYLAVILVTFLRPVRFWHSNQTSVPEFHSSFLRELLRVGYYLLLTLVFPRIGWVVLLFLTNFEINGSIPRATPSSLEKASFVVFALIWIYNDTLQVISSSGSQKELMSFMVEYLGDSSMTGVLLFIAASGKSRLFRNKKLETLASMVLALLVYFSLASVLLFTGELFNKNGFNMLCDIMMQKLRIIAWANWVKMQPGKELKYVVLILILLPVHIYSYIY